MTLKSKLVAFFVIITSLSLILSGFLLLHISKTAVKKTILRESLNVAVEAANEIDLLMINAIEILKAYSEIITVNKLDRWKCTVLISNLTKHFEQFQEVYITDKKGQVIAASNIEDPLSDLSADIAYKKAIQGETYLSDAYITPQMLPAVKISTPIKRLGQIDGSLIIELNLKWVWNLVDNIDIGKTGFAYILSKSGLLIAHPNKIWVLKKRNLKYLSIVKNVLKGQRDAQIFTNAEGKKVIGACVPINKRGLCL